MLIIVGVIVSISLSFAQNPGKGNKTPEQRATNRSEMLAKKLVLTAEQKQSMYTLILDRINKAEPIRAKYAADKKGMHKELKPIMEEFNTKVKALLTPEQLTKWEQIKAEQKGKRKAKKGDSATDNDLDD